MSFSQGIFISWDARCWCSRLDFLEDRLWASSTRLWTRMLAWMGGSKKKMTQQGSKGHNTKHPRKSMLRSDNREGKHCVYTKLHAEPALITADLGSWTGRRRGAFSTYHIGTWRQWRGLQNYVSGANYWHALVSNRFMIPGYSPGFQVNVNLDCWRKITFGRVGHWTISQPYQTPRQNTAPHFRCVS